ncbi:MAG TPA: dihydropteroate synthase, partial [Streptosporangiaceae bacterium]|nr:dihydropteroate synthase [Streptosporangiaceae bacterium]
MHTILSSATKTVRIGDDQPFAIIGERINPTGRKIFQQQLRQGDLSRVEIDVKEQVAGGAMLLDVNMGAPLADEAALMAQAVRLIQELTDLPLVIDSSIIEVLDAGLAAYQGKALVNSVTAEDDRLAAILPLVRKYGAAVIGLPNDEEEIPEEPARRVELARKLIDVAGQVAGGAMVLDVNMGAPLVDEAELMVRAVKLIQGLTDLPLCIDSSIVEVLDAGLAAYQGKALVNSVTAEDERLEAILPLVRK